jgi:hypothetical protein
MMTTSPKCEHCLASLTISCINPAKTIEKGGGDYDNRRNCSQDGEIRPSASKTRKNTAMEMYSTSKKDECTDRNRENSEMRGIEFLKTSMPQRTMKSKNQIKCETQDIAACVKPQG